MANIIPQTVFKLLSDVPFTPEQKHTINFPNVTAQTTYMNSKVAYTFSDMSFVRHTGHSVRIKISSEAIYHCSYCMFQNLGFGTKWFYAFITNIEYVNNETAELEILIDGFQTWLFNLNIGRCFVEREHVSDDTIGSHTLPEGLDIGPYVANATDTYFFKNWKIIIQSSPNVRYDPTTGEPLVIPDQHGEMWGNIYSGSQYNVATNAEEANNLITLALQAGNNITQIYMAPTEFNNSSFMVSPSITQGTTINGYTPVNKKLLCYPYNLFRAYSTDGTSQEYRFENDFSYIFRVYNNFANKVECMLVPTHYQNVANNQQFAVGLSNFPICSWADNGFLTYMSGSAIGDMLKAGLNSVAGILSASPATAIGSGLNSIGNTVGAYYGDTKAHGNTSSAYLNANNGTMGFVFSRMSILAEYAKSIDDYFTRFGYRVSVYKVPAINSRASFNYVQTRDAYVTGTAPSYALEELRRMLDNGVTFWHTVNALNYSLDNSIREEVSENGEEEQVLERSVAFC